jgi:F0F1-type ATP synthase assembly protein I
MSAQDEEPPKSSSAPGLPRIYLGFLASSLVIIALLLILGYEPTRRLAGRLALPAMGIGCLISLLAALVGSLPVFLARGRKAADTVPALLASMAVRVLTALMLLAIAGSNAKLEPLMNTLVVWLLISHAALLVAEIRFARRALYT